MYEGRTSLHTLWMRVRPVDPPSCCSACSAAYVVCRVLHVACCMLHGSRTCRRSSHSLTRRRSTRPSRSSPSSARSLLPRPTTCPHLPTTCPHLPTTGVKRVRGGRRAWLRSMLQCKQYSTCPSGSCPRKESCWSAPHALRLEGAPRLRLGTLALRCVALRCVREHVSVSKCK